MNVLILGNPTELHAAHVHTALTQAGAQAHYWDTVQFPTQIQLAWCPDQPTGHIRFPDGAVMPLQDIHAVYWRQFSGVQVLPLPDPEQAQMALNDSLGLLRSLLNLDSIHWVNSWFAYQFHQEKPRQLRVVNQLGIPIPPTLVSNDPVAVRQFAQSQARVIFKPVYGGAHTQVLEEHHLDAQRLALSLRLCPVTLQAYVPGTNIRSYVIGDAVFSAEIRSQDIDFRQDSQATVLPLTTSETLRQQCLAIAHALGLQWTAIDWRRTPDSEDIFLEANPSPMFIYFEQQTGFPITQRLVQLLLQPGPTAIKSTTACAVVR
jgi:hypothetical protein